MVIYLISGSGQEAGKSTLAAKLAGPGNVWSIAGGLRHELKHRFPEYDWFNKSQQYKDHTRCDAYKYGYTIRDVLREVGQERGAADPVYWVNRLIVQIKQRPALGSVLAVDDVRRIAEVECFKRHFPNECLHLHVETPHAIKEPLFDNDLLIKQADYVLRWHK